MAPSTTGLYNTTITEDLSNAEPFYSFAFDSFYGIKIFYYIIGGAITICLCCCIVIACSKCKCPKTKTKPKEQQKIEKKHVEMVNGMELHYNYTIKGQKVKSAESSNQNMRSLSNGSLDKAFDRIVNDRKTTITHNPLQSMTYHNNPQSPHTPITPNSVPTPHSLPLQQPYSPQMAGYSQQQQQQQIGSYPATQSMPTPMNPMTFHAVHSNEQIFPQNNHDHDNDDDDDVIENSYDEHTASNSMENGDDDNVDNPQLVVVDTLTNIVNEAKAKQRQNGDEMDTNHVQMVNVMDLYGSSKGNFDMEPSEATQMTDV